MSRTCDACGAGNWRPTFSTERGVKCETLEARVSCGRCGNEFRVSFCIPEIARKDEALKAWKKSLELNPDQERIRKLVDDLSRK